ncbi:MAG: sulfate adenylyltransferase subunit CysN [Myxococcota bacterium]|nr:sulfate adenylyltransferase subunit CysN [Myxococcota bacterium]
MAHKDELIAEDILAYLDAQENKSLLRFITCGSVDDGKSTLIGRLLFESKLLFEDQLAALEADSKKVGTQGGDIDFALLVDGLAAEREQGITIDVAYRFFSTDRRKFIVADTPGHEQYTRNMATGASTAELAILLVDARHGLLTQTRRHSFIVSMLGVRKLVVAINKMDLVDYSQEVFDRIVDQYNEFAKVLDVDMIRCIPVSALKGDNVTEAGTNTPWYEGPTLLEYLETVPVGDRAIENPFRMPVQWVNRPNLDFRGFSGQIAAGEIRPGDAVKSLPSGTESTIARIVTYDGDLDVAHAGQSVTIVLNDEIDVSRGDVLVAGKSPCGVADQFQSTVLWMSDKPMMPGRPYVMKIGTREATVTPAQLKHKVNVNTLVKEPTKTLALNEIGVCNISVDRGIAFDPYTESRATGGFVMIDRMTNNTVGLGLINFELRRASNIHWEAMDIDKAARAEAKDQKPVILWFTGLSGAGKSTIANIVERQLHARGNHTVVLDGDNVRHGLNRDLGFTEADRVENVRRVSEVSKLMVDAGLITLSCFISPFRSERAMARERVEPGEFVEVFVDTPLEVAEARDAKGLYAKARAGEIKNFTGIDSPYEAPDDPEIHLEMKGQSAEDAAGVVIKWLEANGYIR